MRSKIFIFSCLIAASSLAACGFVRPTSSAPSATLPGASSGTPFPTQITEIQTPLSTVEVTSSVPVGPVIITPQDGNSISHLAPGSSVTITQIHMLTLTDGWGAGYGMDDKTEHILRTYDGGKTWTDVTPPEVFDPDNSKSALTYFMDSGHAWAFYYGPLTDSTAIDYETAWCTIDGGKSWQSAPLDISNAAEFYTPGEVTFADAQHGWMLAHVGVGMMHDYVLLFATQNGGQSWQRLADPYNTGDFPMICCKNAIAFRDNLNGWVTGFTQGVEPGIFFHKTTDGGKTWMEAALPGPNEIRIFLPTKTSSAEHIQFRSMIRKMDQCWSNAPT